MTERLDTGVERDYKPPHKHGETPNRNVDKTGKSKGHQKKKKRKIKEKERNGRREKDRPPREGKERRENQTIQKRNAYG